MLDQNVTDRRDAEAILADLFARESRADPYPLFRELQAASPVFAKDGELVVIARYADCQQVLRDPSVLNNPRLSRLGASHPERAESLLFLDPPAHTRIRRLVSKAFTPRVVAGVMPTVHDIVGELIEEMRGRTELNVIEDFAFPLPVRIMCLLLGIPVGEYEQFEPAARRLGRVLDYDLVIPNEDLDDAEGARGALMDYLRDLIVRRRGNLGEDLLSRMIMAEEEGERLTNAELLASCVLLMVAGHETTANLIANGVLALLRNPGELDRLRSDPGLGAGASEETLRYEPPVQFVMRMATRPLTVNGIDITPGTAMLVLLAAASRDPERYLDPDRFDVGRGAADHLAFSAGAHFCLAAALGRAEGAVALSEFATRVIDPELRPETVSYRANVNLRGMRTMTIGHNGVR